MKRSLEGQVALVTGASSGVGWQTALELAGAGMKVCVTARRRAALELLRDEIESRGGECFVAPGDVSDDDDVSWTVACCIARFGHIDVLVNNAGVQSYATFEEHDWDDIKRIFDVTCFGYMRFARTILPHFRAQGSGHIVNVLSMLSVGATPLLSAYVAANHALLGWSESLGMELGSSSIDVSGVLLPSIATPMFDHAATRRSVAPSPIPPVYDVDVAGKAVLHVLHKPAARYVPVFLQGRLVVWAARYAPWLGRAVMAHYGERIIERAGQPPQLTDNLYKPVFRGIGPHGSIAPTPRWKRYGIASALAAVALGLGCGAFAFRAATKGA